jgi:PAS domain S-box-containing protein
MEQTRAMPELEILGIPFANNSYPMWIYDRETLAFLDVNDAAVQAYGFSRQEFLTLTLCDIRPPEDVPELLRQTEPPRPQGQSTAEKWRHAGKDGWAFPVTITSWELTFLGRPAELVLARRENPDL